MAMKLGLILVLRSVVSVYVFVCMYIPVYVNIMIRY